MKEVIFHFFPSVRFLGLSLKILFHKNKEIKRMLSKKMTFSLMSLITILALAFTVTPVMAVGEFSVTITGPTSVTYTLTDRVHDPVTFDLMVETGQPIGDARLPLPVLELQLSNNESRPDAFR